jgi:hypothetical protein
MSRPRWLLPVAVAVALRLFAVAVSDRVVADVRIYRKVGEHVLAGAWNPYELPARFYPYPPAWVWVEAGAEWLARHVPGVGYAIWVKLPIVAADALIVALLLGFGVRLGRGALPAWLFALHPVSLLITGFHGQFDSIALLFVLLALDAHVRGQLDRSALLLCAGIVTKSFPVLLLPFFLVRCGRWRRALRFLLLATLPGAVLLVPYALDDLPALQRELFGYGGFADFGWIGLLRGARWLLTGELLRSEPPHWGVLIPIAKGLFLSAYALLLLGFARGFLRFTLTQAALVVFVAFLALYGSVSAQYLVWVVPIGVLYPRSLLLAHALSATLALVGFYAFLHPGVLLPAGTAFAYDLTHAGVAWVAGVFLVTLVCLAWLLNLLYDGRQPVDVAP